MNHEMMGSGEYFHPVMAAAWIILALVVILALLRYRRSRCKHRGHGALDLLRERYAKGEVDTAEFEERKKALMAQ